MYMPVISQAVNLPCTDPYLWNTVIPRHNNDLKKQNKNTGLYKLQSLNVGLFRNKSLKDLRAISGLYYRGIGQVIISYNPLNILACTRLVLTHHMIAHSPPKTGEYPILVYTTQVNSTFRAR